MFVDVGGLDGLVHYSKISHKGPVNPAKHFKRVMRSMVVAIGFRLEEGRHLITIYSKDCLTSQGTPLGKGLLGLGRHSKEVGWITR